jgi:hypothetical protein
MRRRRSTTRFVPVIPTSTYSGHRSLDAASRESLFRSIANLIGGGYNGRIVKDYLTTLYVAKKK